MTEFPPTAFLPNGEVNSEWALCVPGGVRSWCRWWVHGHDPTRTPRHQTIQECGSPGQVYEEGDRRRPTPAGWSVAEWAPPDLRCGYSPVGWRQTRVPFHVDFGEGGRGLVFWAEQWLTYPASSADPLVMPPADYRPPTNPPGGAVGVPAHPVGETGQ